MNVQDIPDKIRNTEPPLKKQFQKRNWKMKIRTKKFKDSSPIDFLILREKLGIKRYRKMSRREPEKRKLLLDLALKKMEEKEDFILISYKRRKVNIV